jgi:DNA-binding response OmpR family regulator
MSVPLRVLVVDDDGMYLELVERSLRGYGMEVTTTDSSLGVSNLIRLLEPDVVLLDVNIPALSGDALLGLARRTAPERTKFVLFSSADEGALRRRALDCRADGYITKSTAAADLASYLMKMAGRVTPS